MQNCKLKIDEFKAKNKIPADVTIKLSGQSEQELETQKFLGTAFIDCIGIDFFNSCVAV